MDRGFNQIIAAFATCFLTAAAVALAGGFRGNEWGASKAEVRAREKHTLHRERPGELAYFAFELAGVEAGLVYKFEDDRLTGAYYTSRRRTPDAREAWADYQAWRELFDEHFGEHSRQEWVWRDGAEPGEEGLSAVTAGRARLVNHWRLDDTAVRLVIEGEEGAVTRIRAYFEPLP